MVRKTLIRFCSTCTVTLPPITTLTLYTNSLPSAPIHSSWTGVMGTQLCGVNGLVEVSVWMIIVSSIWGWMGCCCWCWWWYPRISLGDHCISVVPPLLLLLLGLGLRVDAGDGMSIDAAQPNDCSGAGLELIADTDQFGLVVVVVLVVVGVSWLLVLVEGGWG